MPLSRRPVAWLASLAVLMNLFVVPLSQALTTQERASLLLGGFCSTPGLVASWPALPLAPLASPARNAFSAPDLPPLRYWRLANPRASPVA